MSVLLESLGFISPPTSQPGKAIFHGLVYDGKPSGLRLFCCLVRKNVVNCSQILFFSPVAARCGATAAVPIMCSPFFFCTSNESPPRRATHMVASLLFRVCYPFLAQKKKKNAQEVKKYKQDVCEKDKLECLRFSIFFIAFKT